MECLDSDDDWRSVCSQLEDQSHDCGGDGSDNVCDQDFDTDDDDESFVLDFQTVLSFGRCLKIPVGETPEGYQTWKNFAVFEICKGPTSTTTDNHNNGILCPPCQTMFQSLQDHIERGLEAFDKTCQAVCRENLPMAGIHCDNSCTSTHKNCWSLVDDSPDNSSCTKECLPAYELLVESALFDATQLRQCQMVIDQHELYGALWAGPMCSDEGRVRIGVFRDKDCLVPVTEERVEEYVLDAYGNRLLFSYTRMDAALPFGQPFSCVDNVHSSTIRQEMCVDMQQMATPCDESALGPDVSVERQRIAGCTSTENVCLKPVGKPTKLASTKLRSTLLSLISRVFLQE